MNKKYLANIFLILIIIAIIIICGYFFYFKNTNIVKNPAKQSTSQFNYGEIIKEKIGINGGILQNAEKSVIVIIPPLKQETELTLSFKKSNFEVKSGVGSPITINISPDINLTDSSIPITIKAKYDAQYDLPIPYLIDENNNLHIVTIGEIDRENHYFTMLTFHGGNYSWIYAETNF